MVAFVISLYGGAALFLALVWSAFSPRPECYIQNGRCVYYVGNNPNGFFMQDVVFGVGMAIIGVVCGILIVRFLPTLTLLVHLLLALASIVIAWRVSEFVEANNPLVTLTDITAQAGVHLRSEGLLLLWAVIQQSIVAIFSRYEQPAHNLE